MPIDIRFFYKNEQKFYKKEIVIATLTDAVSNVIELPSIIEVCLYKLEDNVYGGIDTIKVNRLFINSIIELEDIPKILVHELIHINQKHTGLLRINRNGLCHWHGVPFTSKPPESMTFEDYQNLPWERDVSERQQQVLKDALLYFRNTPKS